MTATPDWAPQFSGALASAAESPNRFAPSLRTGTMLLGLYSPDGNDPQQPHGQDEVYIVVTGTAEFVRAGERVSVAPGDALFVPAGMEHRFEDISPGFTTWVVFYGPEGGEAEA